MGPVLVQARSYWRELLIGLLLLVIVIGSVATCQYSKKGVSEKNQGTIDSLKLTEPAFDSAQLVTLQQEAEHIAAAARLEAAVRQLATVAARQRGIADSLAHAQRWEAAYYAERRHGDTLQAALDSANARADREQAARKEADLRAARDSSRRVALANLVTGLEKDANKAATCRVALILPCITRTQAFVGGVVAGAIGTYALARTRR